MIRTIARIENDFSEKFGIPRQSGLTDNLSTIVFEKEYRDPEAVRGITEYSHLWLLWLFSENVRDEWRPTVRPPRLGGNKRVGVFATRSPFRPNNIGLSSVRLVDVKQDSVNGTVLIVSGADLMNGTPIIDIKPYLPYTDIHHDATGGFSDTVKKKLDVYMPDETPLTDIQKNDLCDILSQDPRPQYQTDEREYTFTFAEHEVTFSVNDKALTVLRIR